MYFAFGSKKTSKFAFAGIDAIDFAVGRRRRIHAILLVDRDGLDLQSREFGQGARIFPPHRSTNSSKSRSTGTAAAGVQVSLRIRGQSPRDRPRRIGELPKTGARSQAPIAAERQVLKTPFSKSV